MRKMLRITTAISAIITGSIFLHAEEPKSSSQYADQKTSYWMNRGSVAIKKRIGQKVNTNQAQNIILVIGDGMSIQTLVAARILEGQKNGNRGEENLLSFEEFPYTALVRTYNTNAQTPDSAGTASAINTGVKTRIGAINTGPEQPAGVCKGTKEYLLKPIAAYAEEIGMSTGFVTTTRVTHATPATVFANSATRSWERDTHLTTEAIQNGCIDIASQLLQFPYGDGIDLALGGGRQNFKIKGTKDGMREDAKDLTKAWLESRDNARYIETRDELIATDPKSQGPLLGLFNKSHMSYEVDRGFEEPSLEEMSSFAVKKLSENDKGFFLMIEAGRIDHAHHNGNALRALEEAVQLSKTIRTIIQQVNLDETLILVTADHAHSMGVLGYSDRGNPILGLAKFEGKYILAKDGKPYTTIGYQNGPGGLDGERRLTQKTDVFQKDYKQEATVLLDSETHGADDVALFAIGPWAHLTRGTIEQNEIFHIIDHALQLRKRASN